jgi:hypothetical protein
MTTAKQTHVAALNRIENYLNGWDMPPPLTTDQEHKANIQALLTATTLATTDTGEAHLISRCKGLQERLRVRQDPN